MKNPEERIIITGASSGIGHALALEYARRGCRMVLVARRRQLLEETAGEARKCGGEAIILEADLIDRSTPGRIVEIAEESFGGWDSVIMNAGISEPLWARRFDSAAVERAVELNYSSVARLLEAVLPRMLERGTGRIAAVSSLAAYRGMPGSGAYNASKAALTTLMESIRTELHGSGITITTIAPGFVRTRLTEKNEFFMPFLMEPDEAARRIVRAIDRGRSEYRFPLGTSLLVRLVQLLPNVVYDRTMGWVREKGTEAMKQ